ncbi:hypothetical protein BCL64_105196 [Halomonas ventosae]|uniref:Uncharacterized protein n=1 Tax=Halomonas ventosae TaxID=229007 RepID=A0A2T0VP66_9GAMM|nr:hypothetical protein BCL64_105196 [Halomonas ventosae]
MDLIPSPPITSNVTGEWEGFSPSRYTCGLAGSDENLPERCVEDEE